MPDLQDEIAKILATRSARLPAVEGLLAGARRLRDGAVQLRSALDRLPADLALDPEIADNRERAVTAVENFADISLTRLEVLRNRYARTTVNIGVSGQKRMGKSTLLQTISGLTDDQIPTGDGLPVTAVRSQIFHTADNERAEITYHSERTFLDDVVAPYCDQLGLAAPRSLVEFSRLPVSERPVGSEPDAVNDNLRERLDQMVKSLGSYEGLLSGSTATVPLDGLRRLVAYPTDWTSTDRPYLAVKEVCIYSAFRVASIEGLGLIDLPGLGEIAAEVEDHHVAGLQNTVDYVLLAKRPDLTQVEWDTHDAAALKMADRARVGIPERRDFVAVVANSDPRLDSAHVGTFADRARKASENSGGGGAFDVFVANVKDRSEFDSIVLTPVLERLARRLPDVDEGIQAAALGEIEPARKEALLAVEALRRGLRGSVFVTADIWSTIDQRSATLRRDLAAALDAFAKELRAEARSADSVDQGYVDSVRASSEAARQWVDQGLGEVDVETWVDKNYKQMVLDRVDSMVLAETINNSHVEIARHFRAANDYINEEQLPRVLLRLSEALEPGLRDLAVAEAGPSGRERLSILADRLEDADRGLDNLVGAFRELANARVPFGVVLYEVIQEELAAFEARVPNEEGELVPAKTVDISEAGARELHTFLVRKGSQTIYQIEKGLVQKGSRISQILVNLVELFGDSLLRFKDADVEFRTLGRTFRDELWPGDFANAESKNAEIKALLTQVQRVHDALAEGKVVAS